MRSTIVCRPSVLTTVLRPREMAQAPSYRTTPRMLRMCRRIDCGEQASEDAFPIINRRAVVRLPSRMRIRQHGRRRRLTLPEGVRRRECENNCDETLPRVALLLCAIVTTELRRLQWKSRVQ